MWVDVCVGRRMCMCVFVFAIQGLTALSTGWPAMLWMVVESLVPFNNKCWVRVRTYGGGA